MKILVLTISIAVVGSAASGARADATYKRDVPAALAAQAGVTEAAAVAIAAKSVPKGKVTSVELEMENGKLIYSMDVKTANRKGIDEVHVDAKTGKQLGRVLHESDAAERVEAASEAKEGKHEAPSKRP